MNKKNTYWIIAGFLNLFTALVHTIGGQLDLVNSLLGSNVTDQVKTEWLGVWHMVTIILFASSYLLIKNGFSGNKNNELVKFIGVLYILFSIPFMVASIYMHIFAPQWILVLPIGLLAKFGSRKN